MRPFLRTCTRLIHVPSMASRQLHPVVFNEREKQITSVLREYAQHYNKSVPKEEQVVLRITGGWVRDKLLGRESHDIDIGIDHLSGLEFVTGLKKYLEEGPSGVETVGIHKIKKNPEKSKHLETCTTHLLGSDIDFVNLRSETYADDSRIPTVEVGTPQQDAFRRDATLNSLFFNLSTLQVEDLTGRGLEDLKNGVLRTPLDPQKTFLDDPLRCLRMIRFAANFDFSIEPSALSAMQQSEIQDALDRKISRERIGTEFRKMVEGADPLYGVELLRDVGFSNVFGFGEKELGDEKEVQLVPGNEGNLEYLLGEGVLQSLDEMVKGLPGKWAEAQGKKRLNTFVEKMGATSDDKLTFYCCLILHRWKGLEVVECDVKPQQGKKKKGKKPKAMSAARLVVVHGLRLPLKIADLTAEILGRMEEFEKGFQKFTQLSRSQLALSMVRPYGDKWWLNVFVYYCLHGSAEYVESFLAHIDAQKLQESYKETVLVKGGELIKLGGRKPGAWMKEVNDRLLTWQLDHPDCTKEDALQEAEKLIVSSH